MNPLSRFIGLAVLLSCSAAHSAEEGITYDCDTAAGHFSELVLPAPDGNFIVTGKAQLRAIAGGSEYLPLVRIQIVEPTRPGAAAKEFAGFTLAGLPTDKRKSKDGQSAVQMLSYNANGKADEFLPTSVLSKPGTVQPFTLAYSGHEVTVTLGSDTRTIPFAHAAPVVRIICSTGEFLLTELEISPAP